MKNWKEQIKRIVEDLNIADDFIPNRETVEIKVWENYTTGIIEKLIADIPDNAWADNGSQTLREQLRNKWL